MEIRIKTLGAELDAFVEYEAARRGIPATTYVKMLLVPSLRDEQRRRECNERRRLQAKETRRNEAQGAG